MHFPKWLCGLYISPKDIKKKKISTTWKTKIDSSAQHDLLSMEEYVVVTGFKALTEYITGN